MVLMPLKAKYRNKNYKIEFQNLHPSGKIETRLVQSSTFKSKTNNSGKKVSAKTLRPRRKVYNV